MTIFNSVGSNYTFSFVLLALKQLMVDSDNQLEKLKNLLADRYQTSADQVQLVYKGRDAIELALRQYKIGEGDVVLSQAFSCYAVEQWITRAGAHVGYVDIEKNSTNLSLATIQKAARGEKNIKALLVQHSLGYPVAQMSKIKQWCKRKKIVLIEDLAQSLGAITDEGKEVGSYGDVVVLSFGRDKIIDAVSGGAVVFKKLEGLPRIGGVRNQNLESVSRYYVVRDMLYPLINWVIRNTYSYGGKYVHFISKQTRFEGNPTIAPTK